MTFNKAKALRQAEKHVQQGKINAAIEAYSKIAEFDPADLTLVNTLGDLLVRAGRIEIAVVNFTMIAENYRENGFTLKAIAMFKKISKLNPQNVDISLKLASLYSQQGLLVEARQQYLLVADSHARTGKSEKALEVYQKIADLDPENTAVRLKLGETYLRENMREPAHDAFVAAGSELIKRGKHSEGLKACLQALEISPDSKDALTVVSEAYIHLGQPERAIELLQTAFEKNPSDVDLITILGRTYLAAGMMNEAEGTFTTLVQLDKSRYEYVLEVGRKFAELGQLDRAAEQLDACVDVLISRREEDRAIDFLQDLLAKDVDHLPSLTRLADIYARIREDHNLISSLETLADVAIRTQQADTAIETLKRLIGLEPENPSHRARLQQLGVRVTGEMTSMPAAAARSRTGADGSIERDIADAARLGSMGDTDSATLILEGVVERAPDSVEAREHLRELYSAQRRNDRASAQCLELARIFNARGESERAQEMTRLAELMDSRGFDLGGTSPAAEAPAPEAFDLSSDWGFATGPAAGGEFDLAPQGSTPAEPAPAPPPSANSGAALRDELEGVDFYIAQGYLEIARDTLDRLSAQFPGSEEISQRYVKLKSTADLKAQMEALGTSAQKAAAEPEASEFDLSAMFDFSGVETEPDKAESSPRDVPSPFSTTELPPVEEILAPSNFDLAAPSPFELAEASKEEVYDWSVPVGTGTEAETEAVVAPARDDSALAAETDAAILDEMLGDIDSQFSAIHTKRPGRTAANKPPEPKAPAVPAAPAEKASGQLGDATQDELLEIFEEFKNTFEQDPAQDFETHYNLGVAYREMELLDDAIEEFQSAIRTTSPTVPDGRFIQCCNMLGLCFMLKEMPRLAVMWFKKGIDTPNRSEDEYQALRFDLGLAYEKAGDIDRAIDAFSEVYANNIQYRDVGEKLRELQAQRNKG
jgi:tetratricopeptide (TPR) repeat protein